MIGPVLAGHVLAASISAPSLSPSIWIAFLCGIIAGFIISRKI